MKRRTLLVVLAISLAFADGLYLFTPRDTADQEINADWVAFMPELEAKQRKAKINFLRSSHSYDPEYPPLTISENGQGFALFSRIAAKCEVTAYSIRSYETPSGQLYDMPDRFFMSGITNASAQCLQSALPRGYKLARLAHSVRPSRIGWGEDELPLAKTPP
ncbi:hypothetical protein WBP06_16950 [Novosphingobium sp. BL-8H]|uniref:hypothetical protein n=1 Tax=Novosphingobium sp. BL-8H TaxID=3127640 RepID=UPI003757D7D9